MHFFCHDTTLKKILSIEKLNLTWNKQTNFNKLGLLLRVFQIVLTGSVQEATIMALTALRVLLIQMHISC